ncbi:hypothetical protein [Streptomyces sp. CB02923]|uniref:hypothetical protein n=1 Tax=Streptomyces sp. CB02923 TaxID=1718985 RepID=UPI000B1F1268|nr:hypothetical protein [Streptomyces sp. CB02923]
MAVSTIGGLMSRFLRTVVAAATVTVCLAATTSCGSAKSSRPPQPPHSEPLTETDLKSLMPTGKTFQGYVAEPEEPSETASPNADADDPPTPSELLYDSHPACEALLDIRVDHLRHRPVAEARTRIEPQFRRGDAIDFTKFHSLKLFSYSVEEAKAVMTSVEEALPKCHEFFAFKASFSSPDSRFVTGKWSAPKAGDDAVAFTWKTMDIAMEQTIPMTVIRTGGVIAVYSGAVRDDIPQQQHQKIRDYLSGTGG